MQINQAGLQIDYLVNIKSIFEKYIKTVKLTKEETEFCEKIDWHPVDELPLKEEFIKKLKPHGFYSPHKSHLINLNLISKYHKEGNILMNNGTWVPVSIRKKKDFLNLGKRGTFFFDILEFNAL